MDEAPRNSDMMLLAGLARPGELAREVGDQQRQGVERLIGMGLAERVERADPAPKFARLLACQSGRGAELLRAWQGLPAQLPGEAPLTERQARALAAIRRHAAAHGSLPSTRKLAGLLGLHSHTGAHRLVAQLIERGRLAALRRRYPAYALVGECPEARP